MDEAKYSLNNIYTHYKSGTIGIARIIKSPQNKLYHRSSEPDEKVENSDKDLEIGR